MSLFKELKRRNVIRVAIAYAVVSWVLIQIGNILFSTLELGPEPGKILLAILLLGFIPAILFAWAFEITPEGIKHEKDVVRDESITNFTAKRLDMVTIGLLITAIGLFGLDRLMQQDDSITNIPATVQTADSSAMDSPLQGKDGNDGANVGSDVEVTIDNKSVAVLPFANMSNNIENEPFTLGLHDDLLTHLSRISALKVISRTSVMEYKDTTKKIKDIAQELGVANILEGGVQRAGNQMRLNVQLIDAKTDEHIWAEIYDEELTTANIFSIQTKISKQIAAALKAQLTEQENESITKAPTDNIEAYNAYLAGKQLLEERRGEPGKEALRLFQKAIKLDPNYALAYVGQATALHLLVEYSDLSFSEALEKAGPLIDKALELDPQLAEAYAIQGTHLLDLELDAEAEVSFLKALKLNPNYATTYHWYGNFLRREGRFSEALALHRKGAELDPLSKIILVNIGWSLRANAQFPEALMQFQRVHDLYPNFPGAVNGIAWVNNDLGNYAQAVIFGNKNVALDKGNILSRNSLILHYLSIGDVKSARDELEKTKQISPGHSLYLVIDSILEVLSSDYKKAQERFVLALEGEPDNTSFKKDLIAFSALNGDCNTVVDIWSELEPEVFTKDYKISLNNFPVETLFAWCLQQTGQEQAGERLLSKLQKFLDDDVQFFTHFRYLELQPELLAAQGKPQAAAKAYADLVNKKQISEWYWFDHIPYFADTRKEPVFIKAREQLMQELQKQRELLKQIRAKETAE